MIRTMGTEETKQHEDMGTTEENLESTKTEADVTDAKATEADQVDLAEDVAEESGAAVEADIKAAVAEMENRYLRLQADFDNYKRRTLQEKEQLAGFVKGDVMEDLFPVLDNFERALQVPATDETKAFLEGFAMIQQNLMASLQKHGLAVIEAVGKPFDPNYHQAVMRVPSDEYDDDTVCEVLQTGYTVDGRTVRPAMVKVVHNG
ncbi:nucleotide exchange factor GrpE [uncultured Veillonella sp.]|uniref:nucleotide exchange factor GrpE n=1 Tax=uncultured Veillonella sp. TaxID=159268 RepID=UPI0025D49379|nr:nucleotide exchange factor GrpE [uncultured Veillonella sp.]MDY3974737.1 nucleotide exchange factor GrpE [Veillonella caviae]